MFVNRTNLDQYFNSYKSKLILLYLKYFVVNFTIPFFEKNDKSWPCTIPVWRYMKT